MKVKNPIDWNAVAAKAEQMTNVELHYAILDCQKTLPHSDALDRVDGGDRGGYYRDEISIYRKEMKDRL